MTRGPTPEEYFKQELGAREKEWNAGYLPALFETVRLCQIWSLPLPEWAALATLNVIIERYNARGRGKKGPSSSPKGKYTGDLKHFWRWNALSFAFRSRGITARRIGRPRKDEPGISAAREEARLQLAGTIAQCASSQIQKSYDLVERSRASGDGQFSFTDAGSPPMTKTQINRRYKKRY
jgi:hypothetical protein